ncbi:MAG TPA: repressor LexA [Leptolyngbyaceae cyanobacterium M33_DOE_097]|uniref:Repressor LexA n=1 Tax=Oscillatoriales cyanobacterium SpSt-418 TaxID=2282169 RepID=A0A7C3KG58_9CYAN|nr:repressor LexA [Leptolyngbyaceae cyanobacterium M33_DOE_097]
MASFLNALEWKVFSWIEEFVAQYGISPTVREIQQGLGYRSPSPVRTRLDALSSKGFISRLPGKTRTIRVLKSSRGIPLLGLISAHSLVETFPEQNIEHLELSLYPKFAKLSNHELSQYFALRVSGDSMIDAHIDHDDVVLLRRETDPKAIRNGTIVAARVNGTTTLKYFSRNGRIIILQPANSNYEATLINTAEQEVQIQGYFVGLMRGIV